jgi:hypothetical protein
MLDTLSRMIHRGFFGAAIDAPDGGETRQSRLRLGRR